MLGGGVFGFVSKMQKKKENKLLLVETSIRGDRKSLHNEKKEGVL